MAKQQRKRSGVWGIDIGQCALKALRCTTADDGETVELEIALNLATQDKIEYLEVIQNGRVVHEVRLSDWAKKKGRRGE